jgi:hypothetical protein
MNRRNRLGLDWCRPDRLCLLALIGFASIAASLVASITANLAASICIPAIGFASIITGFSRLLQ